MNKSLTFANAVPGYIKDQKSPLLVFIQKYYEWSEQNGYPTSDIYNLLNFQDFNKSPSAFYEFFRKEFMPSIPQNNIADKKLLLKNIVDFYQSRGTERSYKFLFQILYGETPTLKYPKDTLFIPSDANWVKDRSVFVVTDDVLPSIEVNSAEFLVGNRVVPIQIRYFERLTDDVYEAFFDTDSQILGDIDFIRINGVQYPLANTISGFDIVNPGRGFVKGQIYRIQVPGATPTDVRVEQVDEAGSIRALTIVNFGAGYVSDFNTVIVPQTEQQAAASLLIETPSGTQAYDSGSSTDNLGDSGLVVKNNYFEAGYLTDDTYVGDLQGFFQGETSQDIPGVAVASLVVKIGQFSSYIGYHTDIKGMPSDLSKVIDSDVIQEFSYIIESSQDFLDYQSPVEKLLHPAGTKFSGEKIIETTIDLAILLKNVLAILDVNLSDEAITVDFIILAIAKGLSDSITTTELVRLLISKQLTDSVSSVDTKVISFGKVATDSVTNTDTTTLATEKGLSDSIATAEDRVFDVSQAKSDESFAEDSGGIALSPFYAGVAADGNEYERRYWEYGYFEGEQAFNYSASLRSNFLTGEQSVEEPKTPSYPTLYLNFVDDRYAINSNG